MSTSVGSGIRGRTSAEIAESVRGLVDRGVLTPGDGLPPVRALADELGVNRNTVVSAYGVLGRTGVVESLGRAGTRITDRARVPQEGYASTDSLRDLASGNPDPALIPDPTRALQTAGGRPILYGEPVIDPGLEAWARAWMEPDAPGDFGLTVTSGAVDAVERLLAQVLTRDDAVALEDPCFLASIHTVRLGGYRAVPVPVDEEGMTVEGLRAALAQGVRAIVCTPRAQNPTGASRSLERAESLRRVLADHPYVLVIEDDYFSLLSQRPFHPIVGPEHRRWALVRSLSKFIGPDIAVALVASDAETANRLAMRLSPGTTWVSHLLQRIAHALLTDDAARAQIQRAGAHYAQRNADFAAHLAEHGVLAQPGDGLSAWVPVGAPAQQVQEGLARRGWRVRPGDEFRFADSSAVSHRLRITVHALSDAEAAALAIDLACAVAEARARG
ncbi:MAG: aminotransferase class I/II-fold pyridoxal phosphate-dependent enzyme [Brevibacterium yomogidense]